MTETATFIINQNPAKVVHLLGLEKNHIRVKIALTQNVGFYEYEQIDISPNVSHEITIRKNEKGRVVINGTYKKFQGKVWCQLEGTPKKLYAVLRSRASFSDHCGSLTRYVTFVMALDQYSQHQNNFRDKRSYLLRHQYIIFNYTLHGSLETESKACYRKTQHSTKKASKKLSKPSQGIENNLQTLNHH